MTSLAEKEGLKGKVQMIYVDPPYGIKFGSNWQVSTRKRDVKDGRVEDASREPEVVKAFRDTWEQEIHSYLPYMRDRLRAAYDLLTETGSIFVQMGDENVHLVRCVMDEVFGSQNFCGEVVYQKAPYATSTLLPPVFDILLWYAKSKDSIKYRQLFQERDSSAAYRYLEASEDTPTDGDNQAQSFQSVSLVSPGPSAGPQEFEFEGDRFRPAPNSHWKTTLDGLRRVGWAGRLFRRRIHYASRATRPTSRWRSGITSGRTPSPGRLQSRRSSSCRLIPRSPSAAF